MYNGHCAGEVKSRNAKPMFLLSTCLNVAFELGVPFWTCPLYKITDSNFALTSLKGWSACQALSRELFTNVIPLGEILRHKNFCSFENHGNWVYQAPKLFINLIYHVFLKNLFVKNFFFNCYYLFIWIESKKKIKQHLKGYSTFFWK